MWTDQISVREDTALGSAHEDVWTEGLRLCGGCPAREDAGRASPPASREDAARSRKLRGLSLDGGKKEGPPSQRRNIDRPPVLGREDTALGSAHEDVWTEGLMLRGRRLTREDAGRASPHMSREDTAHRQKLGDDGKDETSPLGGRSGKRMERHFRLE